jgi:predicted DCC family thiol-disulfide oxidoreductase YuxK
MSEKSKAKVFYNSACPVCRTGVNAQQGMMNACEIEWVDVHSDPHAVNDLGVSIEDVRERLYVRDAEGRTQVGADAFAALWRQTPGLRWLGRIAAIPLVASPARRAYDLFAQRLYAWNRRKGHW